MEHTLVAKVDAVSDGRAPLFAVSFTNGELDTTRSDKIGVKAYQHRKSETTRKLVVRAGDMEYGGNFLSTRDEGKYLGIEDPETGEMTIVPLKYIRLRPAVSITQEVEEELPPAKKTRQEQNDSLIDTFGGAKQKQNMLRRKKHGINSEMIYDALDAAGVEEMSVSAPSTPATPKVEAEEGALPPHDTETTDPDKAYPLDGYLPERIRTELLGFVDDICDVDNDTLTAWKASKKFPQFVINQLENLPLAEHQRKSAAVLVKYLSFLLKLYKMKVQALRVKDPFHTEDNTYSMPASCLTHLMASYTTGIGKGRTVSTRLKDKILVAILLLSLRLERNTLPCNIIMSDLGVGMKKILDVSRAMGLKVKQDKSGEVPIIVVQLVAPLTFPTSRNTPRPKKRS